MFSSLDEQYLTWLYARIGNVEETRKGFTFWSMLRQLYSTEFIWLVANDDNRMEDGRQLRYEFLDETGRHHVDQRWMDRACSFLEMLVGVAKCLSFEDDGSIQHWFWELLNNLGLSGYNDRSYNETAIEDVVHRVVFRTYEPDGFGGLFPLQNPDRDQRQVEIWYQLNAYLIEKH